MATIGTITAVFEADLAGLRTGTAEASSLLRGLVSSVEDITEQLEAASESTVSVRAAVDTSEVEDLADEIEKKAPAVKVKADTKSAKEEADRASQAFSKMWETFTDGVKDNQPLNGAVDALKAVRKAVDGIGDAVETSVANLGDLEKTVDSVIVAVGRFRVAKAMLLGVVASAGAAVRGFGNIGRAFRGDTTSAAVAIGGLGSALAGMAASAAVYGAALGAVRYATADSAYFWASLLMPAVDASAALAGAYVAARVAYSSFGILTKAAAESTGAADFLVKSLQGLHKAFESIPPPVTTAATALARLFGAMELIRKAADKKTTLLEWVGLVARMALMSTAFGATTGAVRALASGTSVLSGAAMGALQAFRGFSDMIPVVATYSAAAAVATGRFKHELQHMASEVVSIRNLADRFGATTQQIEELRYAASSAGVNISQLAKGQQQLFTSISKIKIGQINTENVREAKLAFDRLDISVEDLKENSPQEIFEKVGVALTNMKDPADRIAIAFDLFGKQGAAILPALKSVNMIQRDVERLDVTTNNLEFGRAEALATAFSRASRGAASFAEAGMTAFLELQIAFSNFAGDFFGGLATFYQNSGSIWADASEPMAQIIEIMGRLLNITFRLAGALMRLVGTISDFPAAARFITLVGEAAKYALEYLEDLADAANTFAQVAYDAFVPKYFRGIGADVRSLSEALKEAAINFAIAVALSIALSAVGLDIVLAAVAAAAWNATWAVIQFASSLTFAGVLRALTVWFSAMTTSLVTLAATAVRATAQLVVSILTGDLAAVRSAARIVAAFASIGAAAVYHLATSGVSAIQAYAISVWNVERSVRIASLKMAASWVIATAGFALISIAALAAYENWDKVTGFFENFSQNLAQLFTVEGITSAFESAASYIIGLWDRVKKATLGFFADLATNIKKAFAGIEPPKAMDAVKASAKDIGERRGKIREDNAKAEEFSRGAAVRLGLMSAEDAKVEVEAENQKKLADAIQSSRNRMDELIIESAKYGEAGGQPAEEALAKFNKLQQAFADNPSMGIEEFEKKAQQISDKLSENLTYFSEENATATLKKNREFFKQLNDSAKELAKTAREVSAGSIVEGRLFPTSQAIKAELARVQSDYEFAIREIQKRKQKGLYGSGAAGELNAAIAVEDAQRAQKRAMDEIGRDTGFADEIRKKLDTAFLSGPQKLEKELKKIADNKTLSQAEKLLAGGAAMKEFAEGLFGQSAGKQFREKADSVKYLDPRRERGARLSLAAEARSSLGLDEDLGNTLASGVEKINDMFGFAGESITAVREALKFWPAELSLYNEALAKNRERVLESAGVEKAGSERLNELSQRLASAGATQAEYDLAFGKAMDGFMSSIGATKTPMEDFSTASANIAHQFGMTGESLDQVRKKLGGNAQQLDLFDRAVKAVGDNLFSSLGIEKTPAAEFAETMKKIAESAGLLTNEQRKLAEATAARKRDEALGAGQTSSNFAAFFAETRAKIEGAYGKGGKNAPEEFAAAVRSLMKQIPGGRESPLVKFREDMAKLNSVRGQIGGREYGERRMALQAELQEALMPALQAVMPDRRQVEGADVRSKAGVDTFFRILRGNDNPSLKAQLQIVRNTRDLVEAARDKDAAPVIAQLGRR